MPRFDTKMIGKRVRTQRKRRALSQGELARQIHVRQATLSDLENGQSTGLRAQTLYDLTRALAVSADYLLGLPDEAPDPAHAQAVLE